MDLPQTAVLSTRAAHLHASRDWGSLPCRTSPFGTSGRGRLVAVLDDHTQHQVYSYVLASSRYLCRSSGCRDFMAQHLFGKQVRASQRKRILTRMGRVPLER